MMVGEIFDWMFVHSFLDLFILIIQYMNNLIDRCYDIIGENVKKFLGDFLKSSSPIFCIQPHAFFLSINISQNDICF